MLVSNMITYKIMKTENSYIETYTGEVLATHRRGPQSVKLYVKLHYGKTITYFRLGAISTHKSIQIMAE